VFQRAYCVDVFVCDGISQAHIAPVRGELRVFQSGTLLFNFDNYNSWRSKKNVKYGIQVAELKPVTPEEYRIYLGRAE